MRRDDDTVTLCCPLDDREQDYAAEMMRQTGLTSSANLVRLGLWHLVLLCPTCRGTGRRA